MPGSEDAFTRAIRSACQTYINRNNAAVATPLQFVIKRLPWSHDYPPSYRELRAIIRARPLELACINYCPPGHSRSTQCIVVYSHTDGATTLEDVSNTPAGHGTSAGHYPHQPHKLGQQQQLIVDAAEQYYCSVCNVKCQSAASYDAHIGSQRHKALLLQRAFQQGDVFQDKQGLAVAQLQEVRGLVPGSTYSLQLAVSNTGNAVRTFRCSQLPSLAEVQVLDTGILILPPVRPQQQELQAMLSSR